MAVQADAATLLVELSRLGDDNKWDRNWLPTLRKRDELKEEANLKVHHLSCTKYEFNF